jgi:carotenoid cleavage dioxygenase
MRVDSAYGKTETLSFGSDMQAEEHIVVARPGSSNKGDGWLIAVGFDVTRQQSVATVFDALNLAQGLLALARRPYWVPHCFHGNFSAS